MRNVIQMELNLAQLVFVSVFQDSKDIDVNVVKTIILDQVVIQLPNAVVKLTTLNYSNQLALKPPNCENVVKL